MAAAWQEPFHSTVTDAQSAVVPDRAHIVVIGAGITGPRGHGTGGAACGGRWAVGGATGRNCGHLLSDSASLMPMPVEMFGA